MKNKIYKYDFLVVGGGLIGSLAALALLKKKYTVLVIDKNNLDLKDDRTLAVNANSREFLKNLGLWQKLKPNSEPINKIIIGDYINSNNLFFDQRNVSMGSVIYNRDLLSLAHNKLLKNNLIYKNIKINLSCLNENQVININKKKFIFKKIILSLGKNHKETSLISKINFQSNHHAYVGFFNHKKNHNNYAYEYFTKTGPLAVLPAPKKNKRYSTFIFSTKNYYSKNNIKKLLQKHFRNTHGFIGLDEKINNFPISPHISKNIDNNYLLIGDTLRSIHPVAGQGWNLGIKDIQELLYVVESTSLENIDFTNLYYSRRTFDNFSYLAFTSLLNNFYEKQNIFNKYIIKAGFQTLSKFSSFRNLFIKQAMGNLI